MYIKLNKQEVQISRGVITATEDCVSRNEIAYSASHVM